MINDVLERVAQDKSLENGLIEAMQRNAQRKSSTGEKGDGLYTCTQRPIFVISDRKRTERKLDLNASRISRQYELWNANRREAIPEHSSTKPSSRTRNAVH